MRSLGIALLLAAVLMPLGSVSASAADRDLLPDLEMAPIYGISLLEDGGKLHLRFGTLVFNVGDGPIIVRGSRPRNGKMRHVVQRVRQSDGSARSVAVPDAIMYFESVGVHGHWHLRDFVTMRLSALSGDAPDRLSRKIGFCFYDTTRMPRAQRPPNSTRMTFKGCGDEDSQRVRMGISVGWGDAYEPSYEFQAIDITGLPKGMYRLCSVANPQGIWLEKTADNNSYFADLMIRPGRMTVEVVASAAGAC